MKAQLISETMRSDCDGLERKDGFRESMLRYTVERPVVAESGSDVKKLKCVNKFEINETPYFNRIDVSFFAKLLFRADVEETVDLNKFRFVFQYVIDHLELTDVTNVIKIIGQDDELGVANQLKLLSDILENPKTQSLFYSSLEADKYVFVNNLSATVENEDFFPLSLMSK